MKRLIIITLAAVLSAFAAHSQNKNDVNISDYTLELKEDGYLNLDIDIDLSDLDIKTTQVVVLTPAVINGADTLMLKSIGVYGRNRRIFYMRNEDQKPTGVKDINLTTSETSQIIDYNASVAFMDWMDGCKVELLRTDFGCCGESALISRTELVDRFPIEPYFPELIYIRPQREVVKSREINGSAFVDFPVSQTVIYPEYRNNVVELLEEFLQENDLKIQELIYLWKHEMTEIPTCAVCRQTSGITKWTFFKILFYGMF